jgi:hypothetical protein
VELALDSVGHGQAQIDLVLIHPGVILTQVPDHLSYVSVVKARLERAVHPLHPG